MIPIDPTKHDPAGLVSSSLASLGLYVVAIVMAVDEHKQGRKRGPRGLASAKAKKPKTTEVLGNEDDAFSLDQDSETVALSGDFEVDDEIGELQALYRTAVTCFRARDPRGAMPIINGTIHEADRILRNADEVKLPYDFHWVYASALLDLSILKDEKDKREGESLDDCIEAAIGRCNEGLEHGNGTGLALLNLTMARCLTRKAQRLLIGTSNDLDSVLIIVRRSMSLLESNFEMASYEKLQLAQSFDIIQDFADSLSEQNPELHESVNKWVVDMWTKVLSEDQEEVSALEGCGRVWLSLAQPSLAKIEGIETDSLDSDASEMEGTRLQARTALETSVELLAQALKCAEERNQASGELYCLLAEATISLANTFEEGSYYEKLEASTEIYLKKAEQLPDFELPERFKDMLEDMAAPERDSVLIEADLPSEGNLSLAQSTLTAQRSPSAEIDDHAAGS